MEYKKIIWEKKNASRGRISCQVFLKGGRGYFVGRVRKLKLGQA
jgi:hypothetical protein